MNIKRLSIVTAALSAAIALAPAGKADAGADQRRTVYFSAVDANGALVADLTAADLAVKEGGKDRAIGDLRPAATPMQVFLLVDDGGSGAFQTAVSQFLQVAVGHGQFAISALNPQPNKLTGFTEDVDALKGALARIGPRGRITTVGDQIVDAVGDAAKELRLRDSLRRSIVVVTVGGEQPQSDQADATLNALRDSGASLNVVYVAGRELGKVLGDGPKRSGGVTEQVSGNVTLGPVLAKIADTLMHQYILTYTIPDGVKLNERLLLTTTRKGVTLLAPSRLPEK
jgi:hypothetical protein